jgi:FkbM family methyltransferase
MSILKKVASKLFPSVQSKRVKPWFKANGDKTLRLNYELNENSIVFDLGGYEGQWASDIFSKYQPSIFVFEPFERFAANIKERFQLNKKIQVFSFGLGKEKQTFTIYSDGDSTSVFKKDGQPYNIQISKASTFIADQGIRFIDLMKINIEGGEYDLLEELIETGYVKNIGNIQVQFHDFVENAESRMKEIQDKLRLTHELTYQYEFVWENWKLKS